MTSKRWADYFINEFSQNRLNVVVMDVERDGEPVKLLYEIR